MVSHFRDVRFAFPSAVVHAAAVFEKTVIARAGTAGRCKIQGLSRWERSGKEILG